MKVAIVDDHPALVSGLELLLDRFDCEVVGTAGDTEAGHQLVARQRPNVAVIDLGLPDGSGAGLARRLLELDPTLGVLLYTGVADDEALAEALDCGARGFALKAGPPEELAAAIRTVSRGGRYMDPRVRATVLSRATTDRVSLLSNREREILDLVARGFTGEEAAKRLYISPETVRTHIRNAMGKLEANTRGHAVAIALREGEIDV